LKNLWRSVEIDGTKAYSTAKSLKASFFVNYLDKTLVAVNNTESFRYRILDDQIYVCDQINASAKIGREDDSFGFSLIEYHVDFEIFHTNAKAEIERIQNTTGLFTHTFSDDNVIHF